MMQFAIGTDMRGCAGAMLEWCFAHFRSDSRACRAANAASAMLWARGGRGTEPRRDPAGRVIGTRLVDIGRNTPWGMDAERAAGVAPVRPW